MEATALLISTNDPPRGALEQKIVKTGIFSKTLVCSSGEGVITELERQNVHMIFWAFGTIDDPTEWLETLQRNPTWIDIPLLVFTKEEESGQRLRGLELGACDSVAFVTPTDELAARIRGHIKRSEQIGTLRNRRAELAKIALNDPLTGLGNRASFDLRLGQEVARSRRSGTSFSLMLIDLDHFKWFNDCYGHQAGDTILKAVSRTLTEAVRDADVVCRYAGEKFAIILPEATPVSSRLLAERLHQEFAQLSGSLWQNDSVLTASIGLTCFDGTRISGACELIGEADTALCQAKNKGRNCTEAFLPSTSQLSLAFDYELPGALTIASP